MSKPNYRVAVRLEGETVAYYLAQIGTMEDAVELARVNILVFDAVPDLRDRMLDVMTEFMSKASETLGGETEVRFEVRAAQENERAGRA